MARPIRVLLVAGARPNFMKIAPLIRELEARPGFATYLVHTGQHYDAAMSDNFFADLRIREPDVNLGVGSGSHATQTAEVLARIEPILISQPPDAIIVVGDVNSTLAAALAAVKLHIRVAHVEAGLRSRDRSMPEEINRLLTDAISTWLFTTEPAAADNLRAEGVAEERIHFVGNVMIDSLLENLERARDVDTLSRLRLEPGAYAVLTLHRPSNVDDPGRLRGLFEVLCEINERVPIVFPVHPRTSASIAALLDGKEPALHLTEPLGYLDFLRLMVDAKLVLTDSGGIQEETTALGVPCITLRDQTERPVTVTHGTNVIAGADADLIRAEVARILEGRRKPAGMPDKWDGHAARRIVDVLERDLSSGRERARGWQG